MTNTHRKAVLGAFCAVIVQSCGSDSGDSSNARTGAAEPAAAPAPKAAAVTGEYLAGAWCYAFWESMGESENVGETYIFSADGSLLYQHTPTSPVDRPGSWEVEQGKLRILPKMMGFNLTVKSVSPDEMVLDSMGDHHFRRGACP